MKITFLGHAAVLLESDTQRVLIDPFLTGNPKAGAKPDALDPQTIIVTHAHGDHVGDALAIAERCGASIVSTPEIVRVLAQQRGGNAGHAKFIGANIGGRVHTPTGPIWFTPAWHSSAFNDGTYGGMPMGVVVDLGGKRAYHAGDTALFGDMALIGARGLDVALLPIGAHYTMGPEEALQAVRLLKPKHVVPIHYGTFGLIEQDADAFAAAVHADAGCAGARVQVLASGAALNL